MPGSGGCQAQVGLVPGTGAAPGTAAVLSSAGSSSDICSTDPQLTNPSENKPSPGVKHSGQEGTTPAQGLGFACRSLWPELGTYSSPQAPGVPGTARAQSWPQLNSSRSISCSQLPPASQLAKLSWKPCNEIKRCLQMSFWQCLNRCTEMSALAHVASANKSKVGRQRSSGENWSFFGWQLPEKALSLWEGFHLFLGSTSSFCTIHTTFSLVLPPVLASALQISQGCPKVRGAQAFPLYFRLLVLFHVYFRVV